jgi:hypothetical protein
MKIKDISGDRLSTMFFNHVPVYVHFFFRTGGAQPLREPLLEIY